MSEFKVGDRVMYVGNYIELKYKKGTVIDIGSLLVDFDNFKLGSVQKDKGVLTPSCWYCNENELELIESDLTTEEQDNVAESQAAMQIGKTAKSIVEETGEQFFDKASKVYKEFDTESIEANIELMELARKDGAKFFVPAGSLHTPGAKDDSNKPEMSLVMYGFADALLEVGKVATMGAKKYTPNGWKTVPDGIKRYADAGMRHMLAEAKEPFDKESGLYHAAHFAWNALARLQIILEQK